MKKIIKLTESDITNIVKKILLEQENLNPKGLKVGSGGRKNPAQVNDVKALQQKLMDIGYLKTSSMTPTGYFGQLTNAALQRAVGNKQEVKPTTKPQPSETGYQKPAQKADVQFCQTITPQSDVKDLTNIVNTWHQSYPNIEIYGFINRLLNRYAQAYIDQQIPKEIACQVALVQIRPGYKDKNAIISDTLNKLIYIFDSKGNFLGKSFIISGKNKQSADIQKIAQSLLTWSEQAKTLGFNWVDGKGYVDTTGKNRKYDAEIIYKDTDKTKTRFLPKGIFTTSGEITTASGYAGGKDNKLNLFQNGKELTQAIHGYYIEQPRKKAVEMARKVLSDPNNPAINDEFIKLLSSGKVNLSQSYGCLNVPEEFLPKLREYGKNAYLFNIGEDRTNYLVQNGENYLDKTIGASACPSPQSLGAVVV